MNDVARQRRRIARVFLICFFALFHGGDPVSASATRLKLAKHLDVVGAKVPSITASADMLFRTSLQPDRLQILDGPSLRVLHTISALAPDATVVTWWEHRFVIASSKSIALWDASTGTRVWEILGAREGGALVTPIRSDDGDTLYVPVAARAGTHGACPVLAITPAGVAGRVSLEDCSSYPIDAVETTNPSGLITTYFVTVGQSQAEHQGMPPIGFADAATGRSTGDLTPSGDDGTYVLSGQPSRLSRPRIEAILDRGNDSDKNPARNVAFVSLPDGRIVHEFSCRKTGNVSPLDADVWRVSCDDKDLRVARATGEALPAATAPQKKTGAPFDGIYGWRGAAGIDSALFLEPFDAAGVAWPLPEAQLAWRSPRAIFASGDAIAIADLASGSVRPVATLRSLAEHDSVTFAIAPDGLRATVGWYDVFPTTDACSYNGASQVYDAGTAASVSAIDGYGPDRLYLSDTGAVEGVATNLCARAWGIGPWVKLPHAAPAARSSVEWLPGFDPAPMMIPMADGGAPSAHVPIWRQANALLPSVFFRETHSQQPVANGRWTVAQDLRSAAVLSGTKLVFLDIARHRARRAPLPVCSAGCLISTNGTYVAVLIQATGRYRIRLLSAATLCSVSEASGHGSAQAIELLPGAEGLAVATDSGFDLWRF